MVGQIDDGKGICYLAQTFKQNLFIKKLEKRGRARREDQAYLQGKGVEVRED